MSYNKYGSRFLKGLRSYRVAPELTALAIESFLQSLDCPRSLTVWLLFKSGEHSQLADLGFDPLSYNSVRDIRDSYAATKFLSKFKGLTLDYDLDEVAFAKFEKFEQRCKDTNSRFRYSLAGQKTTGPREWLHHATIRKIESILGEFSPEEFFSMPDWGPGASTLIKRQSASPQEKFQCETGITRDLHALLPTDLLRLTYPHWVQHLESAGYPQFQVGNNVITVPKDSTTNRVIAIEPGINLWFQKSVGDMIANRLRRVGIDLTDQKKNQELARFGSKTGSVATIDLSSASDSIAYSVAEALLPPKWFRIMDSCRSHFGRLKGVLMRWNKFSSMGNGFTFPLESLIFYAVAISCVQYLHLDEKLVSVYGDDVIIPTSAFELFSEMLGFYGFLVNEKKSHYVSPFRESCGAHYFSGFDVKPIYLKDRLSSLLTVFRLANAVRRLAHRRCNFMACSVRFKQTFDLLVRTVPSSLRFWIPEGYGDGGFLSSFDRACPTRLRFHNEGYAFFHVADTGQTREDSRLGYLLAELWRLSKFDQGFGDMSDLADSKNGKKRPTLLETIADYLTRETDSKGRNAVSTKRLQISVCKSTVVRWYDLGPWL